MKATIGICPRASTFVHIDAGLIGVAKIMRARTSGDFMKITIKLFPEKQGMFDKAKLESR